MHRVARILTFLIIASLVAGFAVARLSDADAEKAILQGLRGLRQVPDAERGHATQQLALQIRGLAPGTKKVGLANSLANLSTEGDFGRDTIQTVADTLAQSLKEQPATGKDGDPTAPYMELASLARYEGAKVSLADPQYSAALDKLAAIERVQASADFSLSDIEGKSWTLSALKGKVVLVNFWATWCPPCRKEMPDLQALYDQFKDKGFVVLAISDEDLSKVKPFIAQAQYSYPILLDPGRKVNKLFSVEGIPKSFVYDRQGKLVAQSIDMRTRGQFLAMLRKAGLK